MRQDCDDYDYDPEEPDADDYDDCPACLGTGEGFFDGQSCPVYRGRGY